MNMLLQFLLCIIPVLAAIMAVEVEARRSLPFNVRLIGGVENSAAARELAEYVIRRSIPNGTIFVLDLHPSPGLVEFVQILARAGRKVVIFDHHCPEHGDESSRALEARSCWEQLTGGTGREWAWPDDGSFGDPDAAPFATLPGGQWWTRSTMPSLAGALVYMQLHGSGIPRAKRGDFVLSHSDIDGILSALLVAGRPAIVASAAEAFKLEADVLDGPRGARVPSALSPISLATDRAFCGLPEYSKANPQARALAFEQLAVLIWGAWSGDSGDEHTLQLAGEAYARMCQEAGSLVRNASSMIGQFVAVVDSRNAGRYDVGELTRRVARAYPGAWALATIRGNGPLAGEAGPQISICRLPAGEAAGLDFTVLAAAAFPGVASGLESGVLSNIAALLHLSSARWAELQSSGVLERLAQITAKEQWSTVET